MANNCWLSRARAVAADSQVFRHPNLVHASRCHMDKHMSSARSLDHHHHHLVQTGCVAFCVAFCLSQRLTMDVEREAGGGTGSARRRRRERRLRSMLRHERMSVAMAHAESTHHSAQRQKTARAGREARDALHGHEQVIEVPKILPFDVPMRAAVRVPQLAEQLVEVPTVISYSSLQRTVEQHVYIPVPGGGGPISGLQGFSPGQSSTATPPSKKRISERIVEQIVDPVSSGRLHGSLPGQGSSSSHSPAGVEERVLRTRLRGCPPVSAHPRRLLSWRSRLCRTPSSGCSSGNATLASLTWNRRTRSTVWQAPAGVEVVWIGERNEEGGVRYWHRDTRVSTYDLPPLPPGRGAVPPAQGGIQILGAVPSLLCRDLLHRVQGSFHVAHCSCWKRSLWYSSYRLMGVRALPCGLDYDQFPLRLSCGDGFSDVLTAYGHLVSGSHFSLLVA